MPFWLFAVLAAAVACMVVGAHIRAVKPALQAAVSVFAWLMLMRLVIVLISVSLPGVLR